MSGRRRFNVVSAELERQLGASALEGVVQEYGGQVMPETSRQHRRVERVLARLIPHSGLPDERWEVHVIDDATKNAFVVPGGRVFVFRGMLELCRSDDMLAAVLGHEIAHNAAHHTAENLSRAMLLLPLGVLVWAVTAVDPSIIKSATALIITLPGSRKAEAEADYIGLLMMAESCYDPEAAMQLWARMEKEEKGAPPQFLSTHPSNHDRLSKIRAWLPEAEAKRESSECGATAAYGKACPTNISCGRGGEC